MNILTRLTTTSAILLVAAVTAACGGGGGGAPADASKDDFCKAQSSLFTNLDIDLTNPDAALPSEKELADAMHTWAKEIEKVGTPDGISDDAREGFEETIKAAKDISEADLKSPDLDALESDMSADAKKKVEAFTTYVGDTCGSMFGDLDVPEMQ
ncbi:hypothetical protein J2X46_001947 [Nocardioides sp. BE266]|uniref:hypothetical protein n=1 Tax=Nocardioides sp. BE266 TaxID=2817725 RepID=UPI00285CC4FA|nr:hypothetical protein [Nocardioides sp. BE266]MDR7252962.1 hypothetical protein [Nocardioides sp. BE266]